MKEFTLKLEFLDDKKEKCVLMECKNKSKVKMTILDENGDILLKLSTCEEHFDTQLDDLNSLLKSEIKSYNNKS